MTPIDNLCVVETNGERSVCSLTTPLDLTITNTAPVFVWILLFNGSADIRVRLMHEHTSCYLNGIYLTHGSNNASVNFSVQHVVGKTKSKQQIRGLANDTSNVSFTGRIKINPNASDAIGYQNHRGILLQDTARIITRPELEIDTDEVTCAHGSAVGHFDATELFYLTSRGIPEKEAKKLLIRSFLAEITTPELNDLIEEWIATHV